MAEVVVGSIRSEGFWCRLGILRGRNYILLHVAAKRTRAEPPIGAPSSGHGLGYGDARLDNLRTARGLTQRLYDADPDCRQLKRALRLAPRSTWMIVAPYGLPAWLALATTR